MALNKRSTGTLPKYISLSSIGKVQSHVPSATNQSDDTNSSSSTEEIIRSIRTSTNTHNSTSPGAARTSTESPIFIPQSPTPSIRRHVRFQVTSKIPRFRTRGKKRRTPTPFLNGNRNNKMGMDLAAMTDELRSRLRDLELDMFTFGVNPDLDTDSSADSISGSNGSNRSIDDFLIQHRGGGDIYFDTFAVTKSNGRFCAISSKRLTKGVYEWSTRIRRCDVWKQEIGVIGTADIDIISNLSDHGLSETKSLGARAVYGNELCSDSTFYCSFNRNNTPRCYRELAHSRSVGWIENDVITIHLDLDNGRIKFLLNGLKVRKSLSIQPHNAYYPCISFAGDCQYTLFLGPIASHRM